VIIMASKNEELDKSIDRSLDDFGRWFRRRWWLAILIVLVIWYIAAYDVPLIFQALQNPGSMVGFILYAAFIISLVLFQFVAMFWFLGRPKIRWVMPGETGVGFNDYKGNPEVLEAARRIVVLMRGVKNFKEMGGRVSRGVLLVGPPGTGKSYLAQCIATESGVPFAYASAASFRAMFIGMDVLMIKNLYRKARRMAREYGGCIIFMDEFDAIGMSRGSSTGGMGMGMGGGGFMGMGSGAGGLNELLMQMDPPPFDSTWWKKILRALGLFRGRDQTQPVLTMGATNIPDSLDAALLRPGRFDRKIVVAAPSDRYRGEVIEYYLERVKHEDISLEKLVSDMQGYTPVAIQYVINEAAVIAHFNGRDKINYRDIGEAREAHEHGIRYPRTLSYMEKRRLAYHEAGHALVAAYSPGADPVHKISVIPRGRAALGYTMQLPLDDQFLMTRSQLLDRIRGMLGGRAAEEVVFREVTTGAENDLEHATALARQMVCIFGRSESVGLVRCAQRANGTYLPGIDGTFQRDCSERTAQEIDEEVKKILDQAYSQAKTILQEHRDQLELVTQQLLESETLDAQSFNRLIGRPPTADRHRPAPSVEIAPHPTATGNGHQTHVE
jgi:ATP-dependent Zn protease